MNKEEFYNYLSNPELLSNISENDIDDIITEFPYFQTAYILKAKILSDKKSIKFDNQIKTTSLYALDRRLLYEYINTNYSAQSIKEEAPKEEIIFEEKPELVEEPKTIKTPEKVEIETVEETKEPEIIIEKPTEIVEELKPSEETIEEVEKTELVTDTEIIEKVEEKDEKLEEEKTEPIITETKQEEIIAESKDVEEPTIPSEEPKQEQIVAAKEETEIIAEEPKEIIVEVKSEETVKPIPKTSFSGKRTVADEILDKLRNRIENQEGESIADKILREAKERKAKKKLQVTETPKKKEKPVVKPEPIIEKAKEPEIIKEKELEIIKPKNKIYFVKVNADKLKAQKQEEKALVEIEVKETAKLKRKIYFVKIDSDKLKLHQEKEEKLEIVAEVEELKPIAKRKIYFVKINAKSLFAKLTQVEEKETISEEIIEKPIDLEPELEELIEQPVSSYYNIEDEIEEEVEEISPSSEMGFADWLNFVENRDKKIQKSTTNNLIDKFISENPSISINLEDNVEAEKKEKALEKDDEDGFITETLAGIYIKQKHYDKAILAMEKLSLKYPQKNSYFANRIKEIKNLIKE